MYATNLIIRMYYASYLMCFEVGRFLESFSEMVEAGCQFLLYCFVRFQEAGERVDNLDKKKIEY